MSDSFSHYDSAGSSRMVDISAKAVTKRTAKARAVVKMAPETIDLINNRLLPKGDVFEIARIAGIFAAKRTDEMIPMCHQLNLHFVDVRIHTDAGIHGVVIESEIRLDGKTGAEMEALMAVSTAALTVYDMCKAVDKGMVIESMRLIEKHGGKSDFLSQI